MNIIFYQFSWKLYNDFPADFDNVEFSGKFLIGHKKFYNTKYNNAVSVFYPVDRDFKGEKIYKKYIDHKDSEDYLK